MVVLSCPRTGCIYRTEDLLEDNAVAMMQLHSHSHDTAVVAVLTAETSSEGMGCYDSIARQPCLCLVLVGIIFAIIILIRFIVYFATEEGHSYYAPEESPGEI